jgi:secreted trypsin-like serine protease
MRRIVSRRAVLGIPLLAALLVLLLPSSASAITNGEPDGTAHPYVGIIFNVDTFCTGTLLSPTVFLTAGHCTVLFEGTPTYVTFESDPVVNPDPTQPWFYTDNAVAVADVYTMEGYGAVFPQLTGYSRNDLGIAILAEPVYLDTYAALPDEGQATSFTSSQTFTAVGYGVQEFTPGPGGRQASAYGTRYRATERLISIPAERSQVGAEFLHLTSNPGGGKGGTCFGDSGGPVFLDDTNVIVGVNAFVTNYNCAGQNYATRVDTAEALAFINQFL